ncbi:hypothetical protein [Vulcanisaeta souniana]|uniref:Uncharacterized protein n=2 Tax=Vulcanisaeta souniana TaxID=164452 RepID=A0A830E6R2_9CREN|nr:hypothetical protein [Vulcanisaeta souniana]BDR92416.1 hypothetical protein Vsou_15090 [Vulcanisaeta souniana JCM 11219]GGI75419.1 hypothetical protein GCM10007112_10250 [Vulcanisaeta souniana JCM 11219]
MRFLRRKTTALDEDEEITRLMRRINNRPRFRTEGGKPSRDAVEVYVSNGLRLLERALRDLGAGDDEVRRSLRTGKEVLISNYPNQLDINELARQLLARVRAPQRQRHS